ncbi:hypothetical protein ACVFI8_01255 [Agarivorans sp. MS3-6]|uniref:hypothetical protein n=1 Tax=Agarivorans sp. TSD2052 TaxID=2937286 RepID=UPI00200E8097|nr:hypothetical protein [Agarivorans sp. TSD2052]UPW20337.1 hypothetical protein M0C34_08770 [Agarivorans sp. TSD2052]
MKLKILIPFITLLSIAGCNVSDQLKSEESLCGDLSSLPTEFDITDANIEVLMAPEPSTYPDMAMGNSYSESTEVEYSDIVFSINSEVELIALTKPTSQPFSFALVSKAYACSPALPSTNEKIVDIKITSSTAFDSDLASGDSLKSKFIVSFADSETRFYNYVDDGVEYYSLNQYLEQDDVHAGNVVQLKLAEAPEFSGSYVFFIELSLDSGEVFMLETPEISFTM